jgi:hypothetical protein
MTPYWTYYLVFLGGPLLFALIIKGIIAIGESFKEDAYCNKEEQYAKTKDLKCLLNTQYDEITGNTFVFHKLHPGDADNGISTYFSITSNSTPFNLRLYINRFKNTVEHLNTIVFLINDVTYILNVSTIHSRLKSFTGSYLMAECVDMGNEDPQVNEILKAMLTANTVKVRFIGLSTVRETTLSETEINTIKRPIQYFVELGGEL